MRQLILEADPEMTEERKWKKPSNAMRGVPVWSHNGIVCTGETYSKAVKLTFAHGAQDAGPIWPLQFQPGRQHAASDRHPGREKGRRRRVQGTRQGRGGTQWRQVEEKSSKARKGTVVLLSGGNPQIAKADGDAPVQAYIAAMPGWKRELGKRLDALIVRSAPNVRKAVKWNSPFYGIEGKGWFLSFHVFTRYVKVAFFRGASLQPLPPGASKDKNMRYLDIHEGDELDEAQLASWLKQAAALPGWIP